MKALKDKFMSFEDYKNSQKPKRKPRKLVSSPAKRKPSTKKTTKTRTTRSPKTPTKPRSKSRSPKTPTKPRSPKTPTKPRSPKTPEKKKVTPVKTTKTREKKEPPELFFNKYVKLRQLGNKGKDGRTFLVKKPHSAKELAMKTFRKNKSVKEFEKEVMFQKKAASKGISPKIVDFDVNEKYIVMEKLDRDLLDIIDKQKGKLKLTQEKQIIEIFKKLDDLGIFHGDSNSLNIMEKECSDGQKKLYIIDFGFSALVDDKFKKKYNTDVPNMTFMPLALLIQVKKIFPKISFPYIEKFINEEVIKKLKL
jgi:tRNA A-37 threonylcarbamoyl transferase component Bud32